MAKSASWGIGIEHEMMFGKTVGETTQQVDSENIVSLHVKRANHKLFEKHSVPYREPVLLSQTTTTTTLSAKVVRALAADVDLYFDESFEKIRRIRNPKERRLVQALSSCPRFVRSAGWEFLSFLRDVDMKYDDQTAFLDELEKITFESKSLDEARIAAEKISDAIVAFLKEIDFTIRVDAAFRILKRGHPVLVAFGGGGGPARKERRALKPDELFALFFDVARIHAVQYHFCLDDSIEMDSGFVETKTRSHKNATVERIERELAAAEGRALSLAKEVDADAEMLRFSGETVGGKVEYTGSFHIWMTLPHGDVADSDGLATFMRSHVAFAQRIQLVEPMLLALTSCDPRSIGAGAAHPRANMRGRSDQNPLSGIATTRICDVMMPKDTFDHTFEYVDLPELERAFRKEKRLAKLESLVETKTHDARKKPTPIYVSYDGKSFVKLVGSKDVNRRAFGSYDYIQRHPTRSPLLDRAFVHSSNRSDSDADDPINRALASADADFRMSTGNNVRSPPKTAPDVDGRRFRVLVVRNPAAADRFELRFFDKKESRLLKRAPVVKRPPSLVGIEFRMLDNMVTRNVVNVLRLLVLIAAAAVDAPADEKCVQHSERKHYAKLCADILVRGRYADVPRAYAKDVEGTFGIGGLLLSGKRLDAFEFLAEFAGRMHEAYGNHAVTRLMTSAPERPAFEDSNSAAFDYFFSRRLASDADLQKKVERCRKGGGDDVVDDVFGGDKSWEHDVPYIRRLLGASPPNPPPGAAPLDPPKTIQ